MWRVQLFFEDGATGWSETYWNSAATDFNSLSALTLPLVKKRIPLLQGNNEVGPVMTYIRFENTAVKNSTRVVTAEAIPNSLKTLSADGTEVPWSTVNVRFEFGDGTNQYRSMRQMSGVPDDVIIDPPGPKVTGAWGTQFSNFAKFMTTIGNGWSFPHATYTPVPGVTVQSATRNVDGSLTLVFSAPPATQQQANWYLRGFNPRQWNGRCSFVATGAAPYLSWTSIGKTFSGVGRVSTIGTINTQNLTLYPINGCFIRGETHRARGRPFGASVGRRSSRYRVA